MKALIKIVVVLLLLVAAVVVTAPLYVDRVAHAAIEHGGTHALGVETTLESVSLDVLEGSFGLADLNVKNPEGFPSESFLALGAGSAELKMGSLFTEVIELPSLKLDGTRVNLERTDAGMNYQVILANLGGDASDTPSEPEEASGEGKGYRIGELLLTDIEVHVDLLPVAGKVGQATVPIEEIRLENIGADNAGGVVLSELSGILVQAILEAVAKEGGGILPAGVLSELTDGLANLESLEAMGVQLTSQVSETATKAVSEAVDGAMSEAGKEVDKATDKAKDAVEKAADDALKSLGGALGGGN